MTQLPQHYKQRQSDKRYLGLCGLYLIDETSLAFKVFSHDGNLLFGEADVVVQALVGHLTLHKLLLSLVEFSSRYFQLPLQLCNVSMACLMLWGDSSVELAVLRRKSEAAGGATDLSGQPESAPVVSTTRCRQLGSPETVFSSSPCGVLPLHTDVQPPVAL